MFRLLSFNVYLYLYFFCICILLQLISPVHPRRQCVPRFLSVWWSASGSHSANTCWLYNTMQMQGSSHKRLWLWGALITPFLVLGLTNWMKWNVAVLYISIFLVTCVHQDSFYIRWQNLCKWHDVVRLHLQQNVLLIQIFYTNSFQSLDFSSHKWKYDEPLGVKALVYIS